MPPSTSLPKEAASHRHSSSTGIPSPSIPASPAALTNVRLSTSAQGLAVSPAATALTAANSSARPIPMLPMATRTATYASIVGANTSHRSSMQLSLAPARLPAPSSPPVNIISATRVLLPSASPPTVTRGRRGRKGKANRHRTPTPSIFVQAEPSRQLSTLEARTEKGPISDPQAMTGSETPLHRDRWDTPKSQSSSQDSIPDLVHTFSATSLKLSGSTVSAGDSDAGIDIPIMDDYESAISFTITDPATRIHHMLKELNQFVLEQMRSTEEKFAAIHDSLVEQEQITRKLEQNNRLLFKWAEEFQHNLPK